MTRLSQNCLLAAAIIFSGSFSSVAQADDLKRRPGLGSGETPVKVPFWHKGHPTPTPTPTATPVCTPSPTPTPTPVCTPKPTPTPTPVCTPSPTPTPTPVCTPKPSPTPTPVPTPVCVYKLNINKVDKDGNLKEKDVRGGIEKFKSCMKKHADAAISSCREAFGLKDGQWGQHMDKCVLGSYMQGRSYFGKIKDYNDELKEVVDASPVADKAVCTAHKDDGQCTAGYVYFNESCDAIDPPAPGTKVCGEDTIKYYSTPLSLIWEKGFDIDSRYSYVQFPLELGGSREWYSWKASAQSPLVVYDPEHRGDIRSADQLFGEWTFGGKRLAALDRTRSDVSAPLTTAWANGYEALASLDANGDKRISGPELESLALWFDDNRDGVSQAGEVRRMNDAGVTSLFFEISKVDTHTKSITAAVGYERSVNGKTEIGASVDWFGNGAASQAALVADDVLSKMIASPEELVSGADQAKDESEAAALSTSEIGGVWLWSTDGDESGSGMLVLGDLDGGMISGHSVVEANITGKGAPAKIGKVLTLTGKKVVGEDDTLNIEFSLESEPNMTSRATLMEDGKTLKGTTEVVVEQNGKPVKIRYSWTAKKQS